MTFHRWRIVLPLILLSLSSEVLRAAQPGRGPLIETVVGTGKPELGPVKVAIESNVSNPFGVEIGPDGALYVCEVGNHRVLRLDRTTGRLSVVAGTGQAGYDGDGGPATKAKLNEPYELRFNADGDLFVVEMQNHVVRKVDGRTGQIETVAGMGQAGFSGDGGPATTAELNRPHSIALDGQQRLFIADIGNHRIRVVDLKAGTIDTFAGTGEKQLPSDGQPVSGTPVLGPRALFYQATPAVNIDDFQAGTATERADLGGNTLYVALREGNSVWQIDLKQLTWKHIAGTGAKGDGNGPAARATFDGPKGIAVAADGKVYVVDTENHMIRAIDAEHRRVWTMAGAGRQQRSSSAGESGGAFGGDGGAAPAAFLNRPHGICVAADGDIFIGDSENHRVRRLTPIVQQLQE